jgi:hypothetical protein
MPSFAALPGLKAFAFQARALVSQLETNSKISAYAKI